MAYPSLVTSSTPLSGWNIKASIGFRGPAFAIPLIYLRHTKSTPWSRRILQRRSAIQISGVCNTKLNPSVCERLLVRIITKDASCQASGSLVILHQHSTRALHGNTKHVTTIWRPETFRGHLIYQSEAGRTMKPLRFGTGVTSQDSDHDLIF